MVRRIFRIGASLLLVAALFILQIAPVSAANLDVLHTKLISASPTGEPSSDAFKGSYGPALSANGRFVAFSSGSGNILPDAGPLPGRVVFLYDRQSQTMEIVSRSSTGELATGGDALGVTDDGRYIFFYAAGEGLVAQPPRDSNGNVLSGVYVRDRQNGTTTLLTPNDKASLASPHAVSRDGNVITYLTYSDNGSVGYVYNRTTGVTTQLPSGQPLASNIVQPTISGDGRYVAYTILSQPTDLNAPVHLYRYELATGAMVDFDAQAFDGAVLSYDGSKALYYTHPPVNHPWDLYTKDFTTGEKRLVAANISTGGTGYGVGSLSMSDNEQVITYASEFFKVHVRDMQDGQDTILATQSPGGSWISADGTIVAYDDRLNVPNTRYQVLVASLGSLALPAPILAGPAASHTPYLQWNSVAGADQYNVYRDGIKVATTTFTNHIDTVVAEGNHTYHVTAVDSTGVKHESPASNTVSVLVDKTAPTTSNPTLTPPLIFFSGTMQISASASDALSGVAGGEYYIDTDPGVGSGRPMAYTNGSVRASATIQSLTFGLHRVYIRSYDTAGNWSTTVSAPFFFIGF